MDNLRGSVMMVAAMAFFATEDGFVKQLSGDLAQGQILAFLGLVGAVGFFIAQRAQGVPAWHPALLSWPVMLRNLGELVGTVCFVLAITTADLSTTSAIFQAMPLVVVLGAALFLGEQVGWRRWSAIAAGLIGVAIIIRPGSTEFSLSSLFALGAVLGLATRDLVTRRLGSAIHSAQLTSMAFLVIGIGGVILMPIMGSSFVPMSPLQIVMAFGCILFGGLGYVCLVHATRAGDVAVIAPFRYTRLVFGMLVGIIIFRERPDAMTYLGAAIIVSAGIYAFWRESQVKRSSQAS